MKIEHTVVVQRPPEDVFDYLTEPANLGEWQVSVLEDGDFFGEIALLDEVRRTATVRARTPCLLLGLDRADFRELIAEVPVLRQVFEGVAEARRAELRDEFSSLPAAAPL